MADRIIEEHVVRTGDGGGSGALTGLLVFLVLLVLLAVLYFSGAFHRLFGPHKTEVDININKPGIIMRIS